MRREFLEALHAKTATDPTALGFDDFHALFLNCRFGDRTHTREPR